MGISQNAFSKIENNNTQLTVKHVKDLSRILEVSVLDLLRDDFEIHKPNHILKESVDKDNLIDLLHEIAKKLKAKHPRKHEFYPVLCSMLQAIDQSIDNIH